MTEVRRARAELAQLATTDSLTGLANKRMFHERLDLLIAEAGRGRSFALIVADIDHFKKVNDEHGHAAGDAVLKSVAAAIQGRIRKTDFAARFGGEEICVLLTDVDAEKAKLVAECLRDVIEKNEDSPVRVTASFGVCAWHSSMTAGSLFEATDQALYQAKRAGRNRVVVVVTGEKT